MAITGDYENMSFEGLLEHKLEECPSRCFMVVNNREWSWSDINAAASAIAARLYEMGVGKNSHVGLCSVNCALWIPAFFAIQKLGAIALLLNQTMRAEDIGRTAKTGDAKYILYGEMPEEKKDPDFISHLSETSGVPQKSMMSLRDMSEDEVLRGCDTPESIKKEPDDVAVMIFTSGSTGIAKGVLHSAYNIISAAWINCIDQRLTDSDRTCLILPLFHVFGLVAGLFANAVADSVIYIPDDIHVSTLIGLIYQQKCTVFHSVPTMLIAIMNNKDYTPDKLSSLRCTIISGAAATKAQMEMFQKNLPNDRFRSSYGLSEMAPVTISAYDDDAEKVRTTVGKPVRDIMVRVDENGEICVKGFRLMTAYYKVAASDQPIDNEGWLHTGDLGYIRDDGYVCLTGRIKDIIIRGGENIIPAMVENAISSLEGISDCKVIGVPSDFYGEEVAACIIPNDQAAFDVDEFKKELSENVARYMMPTYIEVFDEFPILGSGKIDMVSLKKDMYGRIGLQKTQ